MAARFEQKMAPKSESTKLEAEGGFVEYTGSNKLKDKKVLITGGEYAVPFFTPTALSSSVLIDLVLVLDDPLRF